jgi:hypothetical protein
VRNFFRLWKRSHLKERKNNSKTKLSGMQTQADDHAEKKLAGTVEKKAHIEDADYLS